jgi:Rrf2 family protein
MMRLSTKGRYAARFMLDLAVNHDKGNILLKDIARRQEISEGYLEHLIPHLKGAGLIISTRGAKGGYRLAKEPSEISLREIIELMEGSLYPVECAENPRACKRSAHCVTTDVWKELGKKITETLEVITLEDLVNEQKIKGEFPILYHI